MRIGSIYRALEARLTLDQQTFEFAPIVVHVRECGTYAGAQIGSAVVSYPAHYAEGAALELGKSASISVGGRTIFKGVVGADPYSVDDQTDEVELVLYDDKWLISAKVIGQIGIGTRGTPAGAKGFADVAFETVFNSDGKPNKDDSFYEFLTGTSAAYWTLKDVMQWIFQYYVDPTISTVAAAQLVGAGYARTPSDLNLIGKTALQAIDSVAQMAGETWGLVPEENESGDVISVFRSVRPGAGTQRTVKLFRPRGRARADSASEWHASSVKISGSVQDSRDVFQAVSAPIVQETTYTSEGGSRLLVQVPGFKDKKYAVRYGVDVTNYSSRSLGSDLSEGSPPKPWLTHLLTRVLDASYITAAQLVADPTLLYTPQISEPILWVNPDESGFRLCKGGYRIDPKNATLDLAQELELFRDVGDDPEKVKIEDWSHVTLLLTVATVLEYPVHAETDAGSRFLPTEFYSVISKTDLVPERRFSNGLPDLAGNKNAIVSPAGALEDYVDVVERLQDSVDSAIEATPEIETPFELSFPFWPEIDIGDRVALVGRSLQVTGNEVVTEIEYRFAEGIPDEVRVRATSVTASCDLDRIRKGEA